jgi:hypothetical protein
MAIQINRSDIFEARCIELLDARCNTATVSEYSNQAPHPLSISLDRAGSRLHAVFRSIRGARLGISIALLCKNNMADMCCSADNKCILDDEFSVFTALCKVDVKGGETGYSPTGAHRGRRST